MPIAFPVSFANKVLRSPLLVPIEKSITSILCSGFDKGVPCLTTA